MILLDPAGFEWGKCLLCLKAWELINSDANPEMSNNFSLPHICPVSTKVGCTVSSGQDISPNTDNNNLQLPEMQDLTASDSLDRISSPDVNISKSGLNSAATTSSMHLKRKRAKAPLVIIEVRLSDRLKGKSDDYKAGTCDSRRCFYCSTDPPTLAPKVIRSLGADFYKMSSKMVSDEALKSKMVRKKKLSARYPNLPMLTNPKKWKMKTKPKRSARRTEVARGFVVAPFANFSRCSSWINSGYILLFESVIRGGPNPSYFIMNFCYDGISIEEIIWMLSEPDSI
jgi:hypothetical protein